jgi:aminopeptidase C
MKSKLLTVAIDLIEAQRRLLVLHYKSDEKELSESYLRRFDKLEKEVRRLTALFWQMQVSIHTIDQEYTDALRDCGGYDGGDFYKD